MLFSSPLIHAKVLTNLTKHLHMTRLNSKRWCHHEIELESTLKIFSTQNLLIRSIACKVQKTQIIMKMILEMMKLLLRL